MKKLEPGQATPFGAHYDGNGINFCLFSTNAESVELCLFDDADREQRLIMPSRSGNLWHGYLAGGKAGQRYGYRVHGLFDPACGQRFNAQKLLLDPSARAVVGEVCDDPRLNGGDDYPDLRDSADVAPKALVIDEAFDWQGDKPPATPWGETVIYEAHVRGLTKSHPQIPEELRGTYAGLAHPVMLQYLQKLGITAVELLPVQHHIDEPRLQRQGLHNYWGYNVLAPCAVEPRYASQRPSVSALSEFKSAVKALHSVGIEVILDVVFNHSAELDVAGPTLSFRGIDNSSWYWLQNDGSNDNMTGCGNALRLVDDDIVAWTIDTLRYWVRECHVDGFRFDLGTLLGRTPVFSTDSPLFTAIHADPLLSTCKLIAEPWDIGSGGYQLGHFPAPFAQWNDVWRDDIRRFWLHGSLPLGQFANRFSSSGDIFTHPLNLPSNSVNFIAAHDGFTLRDLVSFNQKHNQVNGEDNCDGHDDNLSQNHGEEGLNASPAILHQRRLSQKAMLATLLLSQGTPMLLAGDEHGHSQQGNNNAYCQDNALTWLDWENADEELTSYVAALIALRKQIPALTKNTRWQTGSDDVEWLNVSGQAMTRDGWESGSQQRMQIRLSQRWLLVINASLCDVVMTLPEGDWQLAPPFDNQQGVRDGSQWRAAAKTFCVLVQQGK